MAITIPRIGCWMQRGIYLYGREMPLLNMPGIVYNMIILLDLFEAEVLSL